MNHKTFRSEHDFIIQKIAKKQMKKTRVAINGFGRIGRAFLKVAKERPELEIVAINDLGNIDNFAYLLKYDTAYGRTRIGADGTQIYADKEGNIIFGDSKIKFISEKDPAKLPWKDLDIDIVVECTGLFAGFEKSKVHLDAGAKRVVISAPAKDKPENTVKGETILLGINDEKIKDALITSNASCTTNACAPVLAILNDAFGIEKAMLNTVHAYTASQMIVDGPSKKDFREGRAAAQNIVPSSTGAAIAVGKVMPSLNGKFDGISMRVPVVTGSIADITFISKKNTTAEEVNDVLKEASKSDRWKDTFAVTEEDLVSSDIIGNSHASIADLAFTRVVGGNLVKVLAWYDNEMGYTYTLVEHVVKAGKSINF